MANILNISYAQGSPYRVLSNLTRLLMGQGAKPSYNQKAIEATRYQNSNFRSSQVWTLQALAFPRGTLRKGNVLNPPSDVYNGYNPFTAKGR